MIPIPWLTALSVWILFSFPPNPGLAQGSKDSAPVFGFLREVVVDPQPQGVRVELTGENLPADLRSFTLGQPPRLVLDFPGVLSSFPKKFLEVEHSLLKDIRLGQHPDKLRVVLTFSATELPPHRISREAGGVTITVGKFEKSSEAEAKPLAEEKGGQSAAPAFAGKTPPEKGPPPPAGPPAKASAGREATPPPEKREAERPSVKIYSGEKITLDFIEVDIRRVFALISEASQRQIVPSPEVQGTITLRLIDVPWDQALDAILSIYNLRRVDEGSLIRILPREKS
jgi:hypothetical protein